MELLQNQEKHFYEDQLSSRKGRTSEEVDEEYERERKENLILISQQHQQDLRVLNVTNDLINLNVSLPRSGLVRLTKQVEDKDIQTDSCTSDQPKLRINY